MAVKLILLIIQIDDQGGSKVLTRPQGGNGVDQYHDAAFFVATKYISFLQIAGKYISWHQAALPNQLQFAKELVMTFLH